jgi:3',5'-cyclic AMP phosphodiesterase CpdA
MRALLLFSIVTLWFMVGCGQNSGRPDLTDKIPVTERPWPTDPQKFTFAILGDKTGGGDENWPIFDRAVKEINLTRPDFTIMVGDQIQGYSDNEEKIDSMWKDFRNHAGKLESPLFILPGNHDVLWPTTFRYWEKHLGRTYYSFDYKGCHFLVLNTDALAKEKKPGMGAEQIEFVQKDLAKSTSARYTFVFMHKPAWESSGIDSNWAEV